MGEHFENPFVVETPSYLIFAIFKIFNVCSILICVLYNFGVNQQLFIEYIVAYILSV